MLFTKNFFAIVSAAFSLAALSVHEAGALYTLANCFTGGDCDGRPHDVTSTNIQRIGLSECGSMRAPLGYGKVCTLGLCGGTCQTMTSKSACYKGDAPWLSYCPSGSIERRRA